MPRIFDNIELPLLPAIRESLGVSDRADFCVGYLNLRGWKHVDDLVEAWPGEGGQCCRLLVGMQDIPEREVRDALLGREPAESIDNQLAVRHRRQLAEELRKQLTIGIPTAEDEAALRRLARQLHARKVVVKLFLRHRLHAKLYLMFRQDPTNPITGYLGSSNLTLAGLVKQGELNVDVLDHDATQKLARWFEDRWNDRWCIDITAELAQIIEESWARETPIPPYHIYLKMAYHLSEEARQGILDFAIPKGFELLQEHQKKAIQIAAGHLNKRRGVLIGDVVGLGKTLIGTTVARIFEDDRECETLILCPKNLAPMWEHHRETYGLRGKVISTSMVLRELPALRRYRLVLIDESHNFRNRESKVYRAVADYIERNESFCILMTATPYNKSYLDLANQLRLFIPEDKDLGIRPEALLRRIGESKFALDYQCSPNTLAAFEKSEELDDWRELLRRYMVRRTRSFIIANNASRDEDGRPYLPLADGSRSYFPARLPKVAKFQIDPQYERLYSQNVVDTINGLALPRYGLALFVADPLPPDSTPEEAATIADLSRAGKRLMGFCRTNLFKRLESSGHAFLQSVGRHILRNELFAYALENDLPLPIGTQDPGMLDTRLTDEDTPGDGEPGDEPQPDGGDDPDGEPGRQAKALYETLSTTYQRRFRWIHAAAFQSGLLEKLRSDNAMLQTVLDLCPAWDPGSDGKLEALTKLVSKTHRDEKVLLFTQFADTVHYLVQELGKRGVQAVAGATGGSADPTALARRFSPVSNKHTVSAADEIRVMIATDVLSEGQNLQDAHVVVSYDLPWAIIRLIQRAGRVDRIGQQADTIHCYTFLPASGVDRVIKLRDKVRRRLRENAEVVGTDERFFDDDRNNQAVMDLYNGKAGLLDADEGEVDLASMAYEIWHNAVKGSPDLRRAVENLPDVVYSTKAASPLPQPPPTQGAGAAPSATAASSIPSPFQGEGGVRVAAGSVPSPSQGCVAASPIPSPSQGEGGVRVPTGDSVLVYMQAANENHALAWVGADGATITQSHRDILLAAACEPDTPALPRIDAHHDLVAGAADLIVREQRYVGGALGPRGGARYRTYERLKRYAERIVGTLESSLYETGELERAIEDILRYPLTESAKDALNRQLRSGISDEGLAEMVLAFRRDDRLCRVVGDADSGEARIICSLGLRAGAQP